MEEDFVADEPAPGRVRALGVVLLVAMAAAGVLVVATASQTGPLTLALTVVALLVGAAVGVLLLLCRITVSVGADAVSVAFPPVYRRRIAADELVSVRDVDRVVPSQFGGSGLRFAPGNRVGLLFGPGPGTELTTSGGRTYTVVVRDSEELTAALARLVGRGGQES